jgi:hypothetical protein
MGIIGSFFAITEPYIQQIFSWRSDPFQTKKLHLPTDHILKGCFHMKKTRQLHLWIGLICSVFILIESITGLLLSERSLLGSGGMEMRSPQAISQNTTDGSNAPTAVSGDHASDITAPAGTVDQSQAAPSQGNGQAFKGGAEGGANSLLGIIKGLHEGRIGSTNVKWLVDLTAIGMIFLTVTGITLSIKTLRGQSVRRKKRLAEA